MSENETARRGPLDGIRVLEMGQLLAGPFTGTLLAYFGAEVVKVEPPGRGDPIRGWRLVKGDSSLWWHSVGRNKKCVTLDLRQEEGRRLARQLALEVDVLVENFRPGTMEKWGLGPDELAEVRPELIYVRVSGYGQDGPYASRPGYASVCEGVGGLRYLNGFPDRPPVRPNLSLGDSLSGLHAAFGVLLALLERQRGGRGQVVDVAIYESVFNMLEAVVPEYDGAGAVRGPSGSTITGIVPTNTYLCKDGKHVIIGANGESIYRRLMHAARPLGPGRGPAPGLECRPGRAPGKGRRGGQRLDPDPDLGRGARDPRGSAGAGGLDLQCRRHGRGSALPGPWPLRGGPRRRRAAQDPGHPAQAGLDAGSPPAGRGRSSANTTARSSTTGSASATTSSNSWAPTVSSEEVLI